MSFEDRMNALRAFVKDAKNEDWEILEAGKRVQTIKKSEFEGGKLEFGTEIVSSTCGRLTCLLGASPGASTSVPIMMQVVEKAFPDIVSSPKGQEVISNMIPAWGKPLTKDSFDTNLKNSEKTLHLSSLD